MTLRPIVLDQLGAAPSKATRWWARLWSERGGLGDQGRRSRARKGRDAAERLARAAASDGCPLCRIRAEELNQALEDARTALASVGETRAICTAHLRMLARRIGADEATALARALLDQTLARLGVLLAQGAPPPSGHAADCEVCVRVCDGLAQAVAGVPELLSVADDALAARFARSLCMPHFIHVLPLTEGRALRLLIKQCGDQLAGLRAELAEFFRKSDYRFAHEPKGAEQTAWLRAFALFGGPPFPERRSVGRVRGEGAAGESRSDRDDQGGGPW